MVKRFKRWWFRVAIVSDITNGELVIIFVVFQAVSALFDLIPEVQ